MKGVEITLSFIGTIVRVCVLIICIFVIYNVGKKAYDFGFRIFAEGPMSEAPGRDIIVSVEDEGMTDLAKKLEDKGLVSDWMIFYVQAKLSEFKGEIENGVYTLNTSMDTNAMMAVLTKAEVEDEEGEEAPGFDGESPVDINPSEYDNTDVVEAGSDLVEGDLAAGEVPYAGEGGDIEMTTEGEDTGDEANEPTIDIEVGE